jgi:hypothetical protein
MQWLNSEDKMNKDGYPEEHELKKIEQWDYHGFQELMEYIEDLWKYPHYWTQTKNSFGHNEYHISTGGWSGNEDIITALQGNLMFWAMCWMKSERGGHFVFEIRKNKESK